MTMVSTLCVVSLIVFLPPSMGHHYDKQFLPHENRKPPWHSRTSPQDDVSGPRDRVSTSVPSRYDGLWSAPPALVLGSDTANLDVRLEALGTKLSRAIDRHTERGRGDVEHEVRQVVRAFAEIMGASDTSRTNFSQRLVRDRANRLDLVSFIVFHRALYADLYDGVLGEEEKGTSASQALPPSEVAAAPHDRAVTKLAFPESAAVLNYLRCRQSRERTSSGSVGHPSSGILHMEQQPCLPGEVVDVGYRSWSTRSVVFVATNKNVTKDVPTSLARAKLLNEWELPGFDESWESKSLRINQYGVMLSLFRSNVTSLASSAVVDSDLACSRDAFAGSVVPDTVLSRAMRTSLLQPAAERNVMQHWIAFFQYDMKLPEALFRAIRKRVAQIQALEALVEAVELVDGASASLRGAPVDTSASVDRLAKQKCCIFYGLSERTYYLLHNPLGQQLRDDYNALYRTSVTLEQLPAWSATDAFVIPAVVYNKVMPFLAWVLNTQRRNATHYPLKRTPRAAPGGRSAISTEGAMGGTASGGHSVPPQRDHQIDDVDDATNDELWPDAPPAERGQLAASPIEVVEAALALALGVEMTTFVTFEIPIRHLPASELERLAGE